VGRGFVSVRVRRRGETTEHVGDPLVERVDAGDAPEELTGPVGRRRRLA